VRVETGASPVEGLPALNYCEVALSIEELEFIFPMPKHDYDIIWIKLKLDDVIFCCADKFPGDGFRARTRDFV
jgi:hypothetical protein